jgi:hypothetical protein
MNVASELGDIADVIQFDPSPFWLVTAALLGVLTYVEIQIMFHD